LLIEPLTRGHDRKAFDCGDETVNQFLREKAMQDQDRDLSRTMVLVDPAEATGRIVGYHTLILMQVRQEEIPDDRPRIRRGIPVILLGQIGIDRRFQGRGLGDLMLIDVQSRVKEIAQKVGVRALMLDARTEQLAKWYQDHDFVGFSGNLRMFKSLQAIRALLA
jgi:GNAT superfamily N-acetyltransferase